MKRMGSTIAILCIFLTAGTAMEAAAPAYSATVHQMDGNMNTETHAVSVPQVDGNPNRLSPLSRPKYGLIPASDIGNYRYTDRYLDLGESDVSHYFILQEDYKRPTIGLEEGGLWEVGDGNVCTDKMEFKFLYDVEQSCDGDYAYTLCARCGRCFTTRKPGEKSYGFTRGEIMSARIYRQWHDKAGSEIPVHQYEKLLGEARDELLKIPDGGIVIPGECHCKYPDPVSVNVVGDKFYVCCFCGRVRLPDEVGGIPMGPTQWRIVKGEDKPFPGFNNEKK